MALCKAVVRSDVKRFNLAEFVATQRIVLFKLYTLSFLLANVAG